VLDRRPTLNGTRKHLEHGSDGIYCSRSAAPGPFIRTFEIDAVRRVKHSSDELPADTVRIVCGTISTVTKIGFQVGFTAVAYYYFRNTNAARNCDRLFCANIRVSHVTYQYTSGSFVCDRCCFPGSTHGDGTSCSFSGTGYFLVRTVPNAFPTTFPPRWSSCATSREMSRSDGQLIAIRDPLSNSPFPGETRARDPNQPQGQSALCSRCLTFLSARAYNIGFQVGSSIRVRIKSCAWMEYAPWTTFLRPRHQGQSSSARGFGFVLHRLPPPWPNLPELMKSHAKASVER